MPTTNHPDLTDLGPAVPPPSWWRPGLNPAAEIDEGGTHVLLWVRYFGETSGHGDELCGDVWIDCEDRYVDGRLLRSQPRLFIDTAGGQIDAARARNIAHALMEAADVPSCWRVPNE
jgi:hypothetical protein